MEIFENVQSRPQSLGLILRKIIIEVVINSTHKHMRVTVSYQCALSPVGWCLVSSYRHDAAQGLLIAPIHANFGMA